MYDYSDNHRRLKRNFHYAKCEPRLRARAMTLLRVLASIESGKSVEQATRQFGIKRQYFYVWIRRSVTADYTREGLKEKSQRPHRSPKATPEDIIRKAGEIRRMEGSGGHAVAGGEAVRQGGRGKPQPWWASLPAMEFQSYYVLRSN
jgi:transposase